MLLDPKTNLNLVYLKRLDKTLTDFSKSCRNQIDTTEEPTSTTAFCLNVYWFFCLRLNHFKILLQFIVQYFGFISNLPFTKPILFQSVLRGSLRYRKRSLLSLHHNILEYANSRRFTDDDFVSICTAQTKYEASLFGFLYDFKLIFKTLSSLLFINVHRSDLLKTQTYLNLPVVTEFKLVVDLSNNYSLHFENETDVFSIVSHPRNIIKLGTFTKVKFT